MAGAEEKKPDDAKKTEQERQEREIAEVETPPGQRSYPSRVHLPQGDGPNRSYKRDDPR